MASALNAALRFMLSCHKLLASPSIRNPTVERVFGKSRAAFGPSLPNAVSESSQERKAGGLRANCAPAGARAESGKTKLAARMKKSCFDT